MKRSRLFSGRLTALALLAATVAACSDDPIGPRTAEDVEFAAELGVDLDQMQRLPTGVYIQTLQQGDGFPVASGDVEVGYTLWLSDGTEIEQQSSFTFELNTEAVIPGFNDGVSGMAVGETRLIVIPSDQGYGGTERGAIPANSVLVFRVELISASEVAGPI